MGRAALLAALVAPSRAYYESTCTWKSPDGTEFDLCGLQVNAPRAPRPTAYS